MRCVAGQKGSMLVGIMGLISVATLTHFVLANKEWFHTQFHTAERFSEDAQSFTTQTRMLLSDARVCRTVFSGRTMDELAASLQPGGQGIVSSDLADLVLGRKNVPSSLRVSAVKLDDVINQDEGYQFRTMTYELVSGGIQNRRQLVKLPVYFVMDDHSVIKSCRATVFVGQMSAEDHICKFLNSETIFDPADGTCKADTGVM